ncbi:EamA-like transporter family protein [anaerobic digester metagenome]
MSNKQKGILSVLISAVIFGSMPLMARIIYDENGNSMSLTLYRFVLSLPVLYILIRRNVQEEIKINKSELAKIILVGIFGYSATALLLYTSYNYISTGTATTLHFIYPVLVIIGGMVFYKEKPTPAKTISVILCVLGMIMFYNGDTKFDIFGMMIAFASGITYSFYILYIEKSDLKNMGTFKLTFYLCLVSSVVLFAVCIATGNLALNMTLKGWMLSLFLSISVTLGGVCLFQKGVKLIGSQSTSVLSTFEPITSILIGILIFNESCNFRTILGFIFILIAALLVALYEE